MAHNPPVLVDEIVDAIITEVLMSDGELQGAPLEGRIFPSMEDGNGYPVLVVSGVSGEATRTLNQQHVWRDATIQIVARDKGGTDKSSLVLIMRRVSILLEGKRLQAGGVYIGPFSEARERPRGPEDVNGDIYTSILVEYDVKAYRL